jgi:hypothetical protein
MEPQTGSDDDLRELLIRLDDTYLDADVPETRDGPDAEPGPTMNTPVGTHVYPLKLPVALWHQLERHAGRGKVATFIRMAIREKLAQPHLPALVTAVKNALPILEELLSTADGDYGQQEYLVLQEAITKFDQ